MNTQDEISLAEAVGRLTEENKALKIEMSNLRHGHSTAKAKAFAFSLAAAGAIALLGGYPAWKTITASGQVDHCYVEFVNDAHCPQFIRLKGNVDWRNDPSFGDFPSIEAAQAHAGKLNCRMGPPQ